MEVRNAIILVANLLALVVAPLLSGCDTGALDNSSAAPVITSVVPAAGKVGTTVAVQGTTFGNTAGTVNFQDPAGNLVPAQIDTWTDSLILTRVPFVSGSENATIATKVGVTTSSGAVPQSLPAFSVTTQ